MTHSARPFRFGMQTRGNVDLKQQARRAEALGYDVLLMPDHFGRQLAIGPALAVVAEATTTLRIGTLVWQNDLRHPALLAMEAATLDVLSGGRFELGIVAGGSWPPDFEVTGIPFDPPGVRVSRLEESVRVLKGLTGPDPLTFAGKHYTITNFQGMPKPVQPHLSLLIAGGGARMLRSRRARGRHRWPGPADAPGGRVRRSRFSGSMPLPRKQRPSGEWRVTRPARSNSTS